MLDDDKKHTKGFGKQSPTLNHSECIISQYGKFILFNIPKKEIIRGFFGSYLQKINITQDWALLSLYKYKYHVLQRSILKTVNYHCSLFKTLILCNKSAYYSYLFNFHNV
jgi:hypothetical protein